MISPADRISKVEEYYFSKKLKQIAEMNKLGDPILNLGIGNPDRPPHQEVINELVAEASKQVGHGYQSYVGIPELREAFSAWYKKWYNVDIDATTETLPLIGSKEGITHITLAFVNPGDGVLIPNPGYPTYSSVSKLAQANCIAYDLTEANGWYPDLEALEKLDLSSVKLMWINYPNMPTGTKADINKLTALVEFAKRNNIVLANDNPYSFILNDEQLSIFQVEGAKEVAIELNSLSKSHNMAGWRIGMLASNPTFVNYILRVKSNVDTGMFKPMQLAAVKALTLGKDWYTEVNEAYAERRELVFDFLSALGCTYDKSQVGMFVWAKLPDNVTSAEAFSENILQKARVFITPGFIFGSNGEGYLRISLCSSMQLLNEAIERCQKVGIIERCES